MQTTATQAAGSGGAGSAGDGAIAQALGGSETSHLFTTLLVAQIRNQNPLEPTDPSEFVAQLTQLSQTESMQALVAQSNAQASTLNSLQSLALGAQVGTRVLVQADSAQLDTQPVDGRVVLSQAATLTARLVGPDGHEHAIDLGRQGAGEIAFTLDPQALGLPPGRYAVAVQDESGAALPLELGGALRAVRLLPSGGAALDIAGVGSVDAASVTRFLGRP